MRSIRTRQALYDRQMKRFWHHADYDIRKSVERDCLSENLGIALKLLPPQTVD